ncbi:hypothetical protein RRG08_007701 [Elysia crispata]|uniref:Uncharacterized protein n=1 Tax=Elysia crispata TaxID=231223 RepID=A0AAE0YTF0_9GAST|nr:hypothetical protein RRG08_007701 [Elysia crispata]
MVAGWTGGEAYQTYTTRMRCSGYSVWTSGCNVNSTPYRVAFPLDNITQHATVTANRNLPLTVRSSGIEAKNPILHIASLARVFLCL